MPTKTTLDHLWPQVHEEREILASFLGELTPQEWDAPTLCSAWRVRDLVGHLVATTEVKLLQALPLIAAAGFNPNRYMERDGRRRGATSVPNLLAAFRASVARTTCPPGQSALAMLEDIVIHQIDVRRPLARSRAVPEERMILVADYLHPNKFYPGPKLARGLRLRATDADWSAGEGPEVSGPIEALCLTMSGRYVALDELSGEGCATLRSRTATR